MALTKQGRNLMAWLKHWKLASRLQDQATPALTEEAKKDEEKALRLFRRQVRARYSLRGRA